MNKRREHKKEVYNNMYKKYLSFRKKTSAQKKRNRLLQSTNSELSKESIRLKEEIKQGMQINSNLKAEIKDLTKDEKQLKDDNRGLYNTLTTLHDDTVAFEKMIGHLLKSLNPEITTSENCNSNGFRQIINNTKDTIQVPEVNYQRYNFKDVVYIQDLSPITEESADVKQSVKPSDINRRLGHRAKLQHSDKCTENVRVGRSVIDEDTDTNILEHSPSSARIQNFNKEIKNIETQSEAEKETIPNVVYSAKELLYSPEGCNGSVIICNGNISIAANADEPVLPSNFLNCSGSQHTTICKDESNSESSLVGINIGPPSDSETTVNEKDFQSSLFANVFPRRRVINKGCSLSLATEEGIEESNNESTIGLESEMSHQVESSIEKSCSDFENVVGNTTTDIKCETDASAVNGLRDKLSLENSSLKNIKQEEGNARDESNVEMLSESTEEPSSKKSVKKKDLFDVSCKSLQEKKHDAKISSRTAVKNSVKGKNCAKRSIQGEKSLEDANKCLRPKKPLNFTESPVVKINKKRKRKLEKAAK